MTKIMNCIFFQEMDVNCIKSKMDLLFRMLTSKWRKLLLKDEVGGNHHSHNGYKIATMFTDWLKGPHLLNGDQICVTRSDWRAGFLLICGALSIGK